jgi:D-alanyl-D-alanine carboxypeptidase/D-alanyl-D-alanine-endopeptidase (penicillin-binding protein 4)
LRAIDELVDQAVAAGLDRVDGDIVGSDVRYAGSPYPESWTADDLQHDYGAPVSALALNDNVVTVTVYPGAAEGDLARVEVDPPVEYFTFQNRVTTAVTGRPHATRVPGSRLVLLDGASQLGGAPWVESLAVDDAALFTAHAVYQALLRRGIPVRGRPVARHTGSLAEGDVLARRLSPPVSELLQTAMKVSQNLHMEMLLREVGYVREGQGTLEAGLRALRSMLALMKIEPTAVVTEDGSGLARNDEVAPQAITRLLTVMSTSILAPVWRELMPVGGQDGTLSNRLCCSSEAVSIRAKTGSLSRAVTLSGYADSPRNGRLAFSILVNNFAATPAEARAWVDKIATALIQ